MKKNRLIWFLVLFAMVISCSDNDSSSSKENGKNIEEKSLLSDKIFNRLDYDKDFMTIQGEFQVWQTKENEIVFLNKEGNNRNLLILQGAEKQSLLKDGNFEIVYLKHSILVNNLDTGSITYLKVPKNEEIAITNKFKDNITIDAQIDGFGLILAYIDYKNDAKLSLDILKKQNSLTIYLSSIFNNRSGCANGGQGSTSCSIAPEGGGGCSVSCGAGYYACCNFNCYCVPNP